MTSGSSKTSGSSFSYVGVIWLINMRSEVDMNDLALWRLWYLLIHTELTCLVAGGLVSVFKYIFSSSEKLEHNTSDTPPVQSTFSSCLGSGCIFSPFIFFIVVSTETSIKRLWTETTSFEIYLNITDLKRTVKRKRELRDCVLNACTESGSELCIPRSTTSIRCIVYFSYLN